VRARTIGTKGLFREQVLAQRGDRVVSEAAHLI
jgi:hypothetical protein